MAEQRNVGRPSKCVPEYVEPILDGLRRGFSVSKVCAMGKAGLLTREGVADPHFPIRDTVFDWLAADAAFLQAYARARLQGCEAIADELFEIGDDNSEDNRWVVSEATGELVRAVDHEHVNRSRLRIDTRKWYLSKIAPKIFGDRLELEHKGDVDLLARLTEARQRVALDDKSSALEGTFTRVIERIIEDGSDLV